LPPADVATGAIEQSGRVTNAHAVSTTIAGRSALLAYGAYGTPDHFGRTVHVAEYWVIGPLGALVFILSGYDDVTTDTTAQRTITSIEFAPRMQ
jgi:hypothetical protein